MTACILNTTDLAVIACCFAGVIIGLALMLWGGK